MTEEDKKVDYLEVDDPIPGQNYVCLSFVSPENIMESKEAFKVSKFLQSYCKDQNLNVEEVMKKYTDYTYKYQDELQKDFDERNKFQTNTWFKVRGTYNIVKKQKNVLNHFNLLILSSCFVDRLVIGSMILVLIRFRWTLHYDQLNEMRRNIKKITSIEISSMKKKNATKLKQLKKK